MYVESHDRFADVGEFDPETGALRTFVRGQMLEEARPSGHFAYLGGELCVFYRYCSALWLQVGRGRWRLDGGVGVRWSKVNDTSELAVVESDDLLVSIRYPSLATIDGDLTPFVEEEHFDFGLFISNVLSDDDRRDRIYAES